MDESYAIRRYEQAAALLPEGEITPGQGGQSPTVTQTDLEQLCDAVTDYSRYAAGETLSRGYLTARAASGWACAARRCCGRGSTPTCGTSRR